MRRIVIACGGRDYEGRHGLSAELSSHMEDAGVTILLHGAASNGDMIWRGAAMRNGIQTISFPVQNERWKKLGRQAGPLRNRLMAEVAELISMHTDDSVEVWALPGGRGTADMCSVGRSRGWVVRQFS